MFHPPHYVEEYSASYYHKASEICHKYGAKFLIHACGNQRENLEQISGLGVDGLEGLAYPPLGNVSLLEALKLTPDNFIITGGISASEISNLKTKAEIFLYVRNLLHQLKPFKHRFVLSASCNTPINTPWETILHFRDAWNKYKSI
jgi:uroporphyrinogen-III decarboxylase